MVGRDKDLEAIKMQFDTLLEGYPALAVIAGDTGIGKTTLIKNALADLVKLNGTCIYVKFEQFNDNKPYPVIARIIEQITSHMLTLPKEKLDGIKEKFNKKLGRDKALITEIIPKPKVFSDGRIKSKSKTTKN